MFRNHKPNESFVDQGVYLLLGVYQALLVSLSSFNSARNSWPRPRRPVRTVVDLATVWDRFLLPKAWVVETTVSVEARVCVENVTVVLAVVRVLSSDSVLSLASIGLAKRPVFTVILQFSISSTGNSKTPVEVTVWRHEYSYLWELRLSWYFDPCSAGEPCSQSVALFAF
jgi:hypothetical protein